MLPTPTFKVRKRQMAAVLGAEMWMEQDGAPLQLRANTAFEHTVGRWRARVRGGFRHHVLTPTPSPTSRLRRKGVPHARCVVGGVAWLVRCLSGKGTARGGTKKCGRTGMGSF